MRSVRVFCPATIANISCGFDILGLSLGSTGDEMVVRESKQKGIQIVKIDGQKLPLETHKNVAGVAGLALLEALGSDAGFEIEIYKKIKPGSGIGSSAASSAGAVFGINELLGKPFTNKELVAFAMQGEALASGVAHADNVAPALLGGISLVRSTDPLDLVKLNCPNELYATVVHPQIEIKTADAREILKRSVSLKQAITQWGNVAGLIAGLYQEDYDLISRSLEDVIVEPIRSILIPSFDLVKKQCKEAGALGTGISGSGPSIFSLSKGIETAEKVAEIKKNIYENIGIAYEVHLSKINPEGTKIIL